MSYRVLNPLLSVRASTDPESEDYERFVNWQSGDIIEEYPPHADIKGWLEAGYIEEVKDDKIERS